MGDGLMKYFKETANGNVRIHAPHIVFFVTRILRGAEESSFRYLAFISAIIRSVKARSIDSCAILPALAST